MLRKSATLVVAVLTLAIVGACTEPNTHRAEPHGHDEPPYITRSDIKDIARTTSDFQRTILADDAVTFAEYERAMLAAVDCMRQARPTNGTLTVTGPFPRKLETGKVDDRFLDYEVEIVGSPGEDDVDDAESAVSNEMDRIVADCRGKHLTDVDRVWSFQHLLTPAERERQRQLTVECLRVTGLGVDDGADAGELLRLIDENFTKPAVPDCYDAHSDLFVLGVR